MRFALLCAACLFSSISNARAAHIGNGPDAYPVEVGFLNAPTTGVSARAFGDTTWTPVDVVGKFANFTVGGQNTGLKFQLWNHSENFYTQFQNLNFMQADTNAYTTHFTETSLTPTARNFQITVTGPAVDPRNVAVSYPTVAIPASVPEPATFALAVLALPFLRLVRTSSRFGG